MRFDGDVLVIAGHDSSGGAGLDADREALEHFGLRILPVATAWTEQQDGRVLAVNPRPVDAWLADVQAGWEKVPRAIKVGLLPGAEHVRALAGWLRALQPRVPVVLDPVLGASGGEEFVDAEGRRAFLEELLPLGLIWTPNLPEAALLGGIALEPLVRRPDERVAVAQKLQAAGARAVLVKGGHGGEDPVADLVFEGGAATWLEHERIPGAELHGSGCRYASALAAGLARGEGLLSSARRAGAWIVQLFS